MPLFFINLLLLIVKYIKVTNLKKTSKHKNIIFNMTT